MKDYYIASFSGGKDSTAMIIKLIEDNAPLDEVINIDTSVEFPVMYEHIAKIREFIESKGIKYTTIKADHNFEYYLLEKPIIPRSDKYKPHNGYGWPLVRCRWCTNRLKLEPVNKYLKSLKDYNVIEYIGIAADEYKRLKERNNILYPLAMWGMTEQDCLKFCVDRGIDFGGLYDNFKRVSCWCCPMASIDSLRTLWQCYPDLWAKLLEWDIKLSDRTNKFRPDYSVQELTEKFENEKKEAKD